MLRSIISILSAVMLFTTSVLANDVIGVFHEQDSTTAPPPYTRENYFATLAPMSGESSKYLGINTSIGNSYLVPSTTLINSKNNDNRSLNYHLGVFGGYGKNYQHFYLGAEVSADYNFIKKDFTINPGTHQITMKVQQPLTFALDVIPGYLVRSRNLLFYGRVGLAMSLYKIKLENNILGKFNSMDKFNLGLRAGLGVEYFLTKNFSLLAEYLYVRYGKLDRSFEFGGNVERYSLDKFDDHQVRIGLSLNF